MMLGMILKEHMSAAMKVMVMVMMTIDQEMKG